MKSLIATLIAAAALVGPQASAYEAVYTLSQVNDGAYILCLVEEGDVLVNIDAQRTLSILSACDASSLTLDFQGDFVLTASNIDTPDKGVLNITTTVPAVATAWEDAFSVEGGGTITLCSSDYNDERFGPVQFFGTGANNTVQLGNTEVMFMAWLKLWLLLT